MNEIIEIEIFGRTYKIRVKGEEDEKYISRLTSYVDQKMQEIAVKSRSADPTKIAVLAALNIADEYFLSQKTARPGGRGHRPDGSRNRERGVEPVQG